MRIITYTLPGEARKVPKMQFTRVAMAAVLLAASAACWSPVKAQVDQRAIARQLQTGDREERLSAATIAATIPTSQLSSELRTSLIGALEREGVLAAQRRRGEISFLEHPELIARLALAVAELRDSRAIPGLSGALGTSPPAMSALAGFGDQAVPEVLRVVSETPVDVSRLNDGLITLRFMVERSEVKPLTRSSLQALKASARQHLTESRSVTTLWRAIDLAVALNDPELRAAVQAIEREPSSVAALTTSDQELIARTQRYASERLAGVPPQPRWSTRGTG